MVDESKKETSYRERVEEEREYEKAKSWLKNAVEGAIKFNSATTVSDMTLVCNDVSPGFVRSLKKLSRKTVDQDEAIDLLSQAIFRGEGREVIEKSGALEQLLDSAEPTDLLQVARRQIEEMLEELPGTIRQIREGLGLSQGQFSRLLGKPTSTVNRWEQPNNHPSLKEFAAMLYLCEVSGSRIPAAFDVLRGEGHVLAGLQTFSVRPGHEEGTIEVTLRENGLKQLAAYFGLEKEPQRSGDRIRAISRSM